MYNTYEEDDDTRMGESPDIYDREVARLTDNPELIRRAWAGEYGDNNSPLFLFCNNSGNFEDFRTGCLTQIRAGIRVALTEGLTTAIRNDCCIPSCVDAITIESLPVFAAWQRRIDKVLGRKAPEDWTP